MANNMFAAGLLDKHTVFFERIFPVSVEQLWQAVATREGLGHWFMPTAYEIEENGRFAFEDAWQGTVTQLEPFRVIEFTPQDTAAAYLRFEISQTGSGVLFRLIDRMEPEKEAAAVIPEAAPDMIYQPGGPGTPWSGLVAGYHSFIDALAEYLLGELPQDDYELLCKKYTAVLDQWYYD